MSIAGPDDNHPMKLQETLCCCCLGCRGCGWCKRQVRRRRPVQRWTARGMCTAARAPTATACCSARRPSTPPSSSWCALPPAPATVPGFRQSPPSHGVPSARGGLYDREALPHLASFDACMRLEGPRAQAGAGFCCLGREPRGFCIGLCGMCRAGRRGTAG